MNYNPLAYKATMHFECQTDFGRWVKFSCITMSLFIVMYIHFSCNVNEWLSLNTISLNIFDRVPVVPICIFYDYKSDNLQMKILNVLSYFCSKLRL